MHKQNFSSFPLKPQWDYDFVKNCWAKCTRSQKDCACEDWEEMDFTGV